MNKNNLSRDIFHDLMPFKVKEILLFANMYDAFSIDKEGRFSDHILGEYYQLNLTSIPRITAVSSFDDLFQKLYSGHYDLVIIMAGTNKDTPIKLSKYIKKSFSTFLFIYCLIIMQRFHITKRQKMSCSPLNSFLFGMAIQESFSPW
jgi:hypothetical protein